MSWNSLFSLVSANLPPVWLLWIGIALLAIYFGTATAILSYHWRNYAYDPNSIKTARRLYFIVAGALFLLLIGAVLTY
ncbi:MAG: hypothetical protein HY978_04695 [Candidatus Liptonbacteria bacterium]|nr:hypothetical protein [Candidatus Liptonbacteria bacterium]